MEVKVLKQKTGKVRKLARGNVNQMMTAKMKENFAFVMVPVACLVSDLKENVLNYLTLLMDKFILQEGWFFIEICTLIIYFILYISKIAILIKNLQNSYLRHFNDRAVYTCDSTHQIVGVDKVTCNSNGEWNGVQPLCKKATSSTQSRYYCGVPPEMPNAKHNGTREQVSLNSSLKAHTRKKSINNSYHIIKRCMDNC